MEGANFDFNTIMDFSNMGGFIADESTFLKPVEGSTSTGGFNFFAGDEGIDTTTGSSFDLGNQMHSSLSTFPETSYTMPQNLSMDNTINGASAWNNTHQMSLSPATRLDDYTPATTLFESLYQPQQLGVSHKRPLQLDVQDFPQSKRHESIAEYADFSPFVPAASVTGSSSWTVDNWPIATPSSSSDIGLTDEAADLCATWFSKYAVLPNDRHIESLSQLTGESHSAIRQWFGQMLKQGMAGHDSAYKSQTSLSQPDQLLNDMSFQTATTDASCNHDTQASSSPVAPRGGRKGCKPTSNPDMLSRDPNKIYQCTRKCGKRYGRKCDWKRNEEEGYPSKSWKCSVCIGQGMEKVKPCFRRYHFSQHFRNIHPGLNSADYEAESVVHSDTSFPQKCGFCPHRFTSRQNRIDHIADHFKKGKCMLDWNDDEDDNIDSDNMDDDDDDRPDSDSFDGSSDDQQDKRSQDHQGPKQNDSGNGSNGPGEKPVPGGFGQFQLSQFDCSDIGDHFPGLSQQVESWNERNNVTNDRIRDDVQPDHQCSYEELSREELLREEHSLQQQRQKQRDSKRQECSLPEQHSIQDKQPAQDQRPIQNQQPAQGQRPTHDQQPAQGQKQIRDQQPVQAEPPIGKQCSSRSSHARHDTAEGGNKDSMARDDVARSLKHEHDQKNIFAAAASWLGVDPPPVNADLYQKSQSFLSVKLLGAGGFSTVDEVIHRETNLRVSRKTLKNREHSAMEELRREVNVLQKLRHPHIIRFLGAYSKGDKMSILLSPVAETTLAVWLERSLIGNPPGIVDTVVNMFGCLVSSVRYLHEQRPVVKHMDIKPQNILVMQGSQEFPHIVLTDFGVSSSEEILSVDRQTKPLTRQYCAPEVPSGIAREQAADIWSLGCVFLEMAATAFSQDNTQWLEFRREFGGNKGKYYWQNVPLLHEWLSGFIDHASTPKETTVILAVASMLNSEPTKRPDAATLTMIFTPAPCCLGWANEKASFPGPNEELETVEMLVREDGVDCCSQLHVRREALAEQRHEPFTQVKNWLEECSHNHDMCRQQVNDNGFLPTRLIDLQPHGSEISANDSIRVVNSVDIEPKALINYVAITHVWGPTELTLSSDRLDLMQSAFTRDKLASVINDAMTAAQNIGYRYMWVDSLCVLQDSPSDVRSEISAMASIYRNAALTIVAHSPTATTINEASQPKDLRDIIANNSPTCTNASHTQPEATQILDFSLDTHSWSLQERLLSRRLLHLAGKQMYWECNALKASETFPHGLSPLLWERVHTKSTSVASSTSTLVSSSSALLSSLSSSTMSSPTPKSSTTRLQSSTRSLRKHGEHRYRNSNTTNNLESAIRRYDESRQPQECEFGAGNPTAMRYKPGADFHFDFNFEIRVDSKVERGDVNIVDKSENGKATGRMDGLVHGDAGVKIEDVESYADMDARRKHGVDGYFST